MPIFDNVVDQVSLSGVQSQVLLDVSPVAKRRIKPKSPKWTSRSKILLQVS